MRIEKTSALSYSKEALRMIFNVITTRRLLVHQEWGGTGKNTVWLDAESSIQKFPLEILARSVRDQTGLQGRLPSNRRLTNIESLREVT